MKRLSLFMFIDALGWEIIKDRDFLKDLLPHRYRVGMQFGYSSTAIPTILTGEKPTAHRHLSFYFYAPESSPFKILRYLLLPYLPGAVFDRWRVRHILSKVLARLYGYTGYFELYAMPFDRIHYFDYIEKTDMFVPNGIRPVPNLADRLVEKGIPHHISNWRLTEQQNIDAMIQDIEKGDIRFAFLYTAAMDGLLHRVTKAGKEVGEKLSWYSERIHRVVQAVEDNYDDYYFAVMSDHGMTTLEGVVDVKSVVERTSGLQFGKDYVATYDSTMGRFWFLSSQAEDRLMAILGEIPHAHILSRQEEAHYAIDFEDHMYGDRFLLMDPGWQIEPCDMGVKALPAMHGFAPEHEDSYAALLSSQPVDLPLNCVDDYFRLMVQKMEGLT